MRKILLSGAVVTSFFIYSVIQRANGQNNANNTNSSLSSPINNSKGMMGSPPMMAGKYKDGSFTGSVADAYYGNIQVKATIQNGRITNVEFLQYPNDRGRSIMINTMAMPLLQSEAIKVQNANVDLVTGATDTSQAFIESLTSALNQAV